jgi:hypothetical protein
MNWLTATLVLMTTVQLGYSAVVDSSPDTTYSWQLEKMNQSIQNRNGKSQAQDNSVEYQDEFKKGTDYDLPTAQVNQAAITSHQGESATSSQSTGALQYYVYQTIPFAFTGISGTGEIQILKDSRMLGLDSIPLDIDGPQKIKYRNALLRLEDSNGRKIDVKVLERPMASIKHSILDGPGPVFEVTVDYSTGFGTYNGPITFFVCPGGGSLDWLSTINSKTGKPEKLRLLSRAERSIWKIRDSHTIIHAFAHPDEAGTSGINFFSRIAYESGHWVEYNRTEPGPMDFESYTPPDSKYP